MDIIDYVNQLMEASYEADITCWNDLTEDEKAGLEDLGWDEVMYNNEMSNFIYD